MGSPSCVPERPPWEHAAGAKWSLQDRAQTYIVVQRTCCIGSPYGACASETWCRTTACKTYSYRSEMKTCKQLIATYVLKASTQSLIFNQSFTLPQRWISVILDFAWNASICRTGGSGAVQDHQLVGAKPQTPLQAGLIKPFRVKYHVYWTLAPTCSARSRIYACRCLYLVSLRKLLPVAFPHDTRVRTPNWSNSNAWDMLWNWGDRFAALRNPTRCNHH